jgi:cbb3-type cytochrome c oxidase subunit III
MMFKSLLMVGVLLSVSNTTLANEAATPAGLEYCTVCHGSQLKGNSNIGAPRLTELPGWYLNRQLKNFKAGVRGNHPEDKTGGEMMSMVSQLTDAEITKIVKWITATESAKPTPSLSANAHKGEQLYQSCASCHGADGHGNKALGAPDISGLNDWYILTQLNHFRTGLRGTAAKDIYGQQMKAASAVITSEQDAANLAAYITQLK